MAGDRSQFNQALRRWDRLHDEKAFSVPNEIGDVAILCSGFGLGDDRLAALEVRSFEAEAERIADVVHSRGIGVAVYHKFTQHDAIEVLTDPTFSSVITIGNGNLSEAYVDDDNGIDWQFVSLASNHLKTGRFTLRHCGQAIRNASVPLGTFAMSDHSDVFGAYGKYLPTVMEASDERLIQRIHTYRRIGYRTVKNLFQQIELTKDDEQAEDQADIDS